jgi:putative acyl-CoA dehydrogenase
VATSGTNPRTALATHEVFNQPPPFSDVDLFDADLFLRHMVKQAGGEAHIAHLSAFGQQVGRTETAALGIAANRNPPVLQTFDRWGRRIDEVEFHPAYHALMHMGLSAGVASRAWTHVQGGHVAHAALLFLMSQAESGVTCPMSMTYASVAALRHDPAIAVAWIPRATSATYDAGVCPAGEKRGVTIGMAMTEKQGGSDLRANTTRATRQNDGSYELVGHKWFCSAPMSDAFLTLAYAGSDLTCFLVPRWRPDGERNAIEIQRLKDKLGDRANASAEIEYRGAHALRLGEAGRGVRTIVDMVNHTRLDCIVGAASLMRQSLSLAIRHAEGRTAFQRKLIDQPLMQAVLADMAVEVEGHMALAFRCAQAFDHSPDEASNNGLARVLTPVAKYWVTKRCPVVVAEAMEALGGGGYIEECLMPRLFRASPLNAIWEGSGNVIALDVLRALSRNPEISDQIAEELQPVRRLSPLAAATLDELADTVLSGAIEARSARWLAERLAILLAASTLLRWGRDATAAALVETRQGASTFGAGAHQLDAASIIADARLQV